MACRSCYVLVKDIWNIAMPILPPITLKTLAACDDGELVLHQLNGFARPALTTSDKTGQRYLVTFEGFRSDLQRCPDPEMIWLASFGQNFTLDANNELFSLAGFKTYIPGWLLLTDAGWEIETVHQESDRVAIFNFSSRKLSVRCGNEAEHMFMCPSWTISIDGKPIIRFHAVANA